jgi:hypothetical protein
VLLQRLVQLAEVQRTVLAVQQPASHEYSEAAYRRQHDDLECGLDGDRSLEEEAGQPVTGQCRDLEPHEQVDRVGGERAADQRGEQQLGKGSQPAELPFADVAELRQQRQEQQGA